MSEIEEIAEKFSISFRHNDLLGAIVVETSSFHEGKIVVVYELAWDNPDERKEVLYKQIQKVRLGEHTKFLAVFADLNIVNHEVGFYDRIKNPKIRGTFVTVWPSRVTKAKL